MNPNHNDLFAETSLVLKIISFNRFARDNFYSDRFKRHPGIKCPYIGHASLGFEDYIKVRNNFNHCPISVKKNDKHIGEHFIDCNTKRAINEIGSIYYVRGSRYSGWGQRPTPTWSNVGRISIQKIET